MIFISTRDTVGFEWLRTSLENEKALEVLNRIIRFTPNGIEYEADIRHGEIIVKQLGLGDAKSLTTPGCEELNGPNDSIKLSLAYGTAFLSIVARGNYLAADRPTFNLQSRIQQGR